MKNNSIKKSFGIVFIVLTSIFAACRSSYHKIEFSPSDYEKFKNTPIANFARYVELGDTGKISKYLQTNADALDYQEPYHMMSLLMMTIVNQRRASFPYSLFAPTPTCGITINENQHRSFCYLLAKGASVNAINAFGETPLMIACSCDFYDQEFIEELIRYGADVNYVLPNQYVNETGNATPLLKAIRSGRLDFVKTLVENGANVNYSDKYLNNPLAMSMYDHRYDITLYLLERGANYNVPVSRLSNHTGNLQDTCRLTLAQELRYHLHPLESEAYKQKIQIVNWLERKGIVYRNVEIPKRVVLIVKKEYPDSWEYYLSRY